MKVNINNVRMAFPSIFEASSFEGGDPKFGGKWVIEPTDKANIEKLDDAMLAVAKEKWGAKAEKIFEGLTKTGKKPEVPFVREGYKNRDGDTYAGFEDNFYLTANSATRPLIIDRDKSPLIASDGKPYAGCYVNVQVEIWAQDNSFGRAIRAQLKGIQFYRDGDAFSGGAPANPDDFDDLGSQGDDSDLA